MSGEGPAAIGPTFGSRLEGIDGLRAIAASSILVLHSWMYSSPSGRRVHIGPLSSYVFPQLHVGVVLFFTLSSFLLYRPFASAIMRAAPLPSLVKYLRNRALRILPAYWVILAVVWLALQAPLVRDSRFDLHTGQDDDPGLFLKQAFLIQNYDRSALGTGIGPTWSLAIEIVFYLSLPLLVLLAWWLAKGAASRARRRTAALVPAVLLLAVGFTGKVAAAFFTGPGTGWSGDWHSVVDRSFWSRADWFAFGIVVAVLRVDSEDGRLRLPLWWRAATASIAAVLFGVTARLEEIGRLNHYAYGTSMALVCGLLLALVVLPGTRATAPLLVRFLNQRSLVAIGIVSYSLFLWHEPLARWFHEHDLVLAGSSGFFVNLAVLAIISGGLSVLTYRFVEAPMLRLKFGRGGSLGARRPDSQVKAAP